MSSFEKWGIDGEDAHTVDIAHPYAEGYGDCGALYRSTLFDNLITEKAETAADQTRGQNWEPVSGLLIADRESHEHELVHRFLEQERGMEPTNGIDFADAVDTVLRDGLPEEAALIANPDLADKYDTSLQNTWAVLTTTDDAYDAITHASEQLFWEPIRPNVVHGIDLNNLDIEPYHGSDIDEFLARYLTPDDTELDAAYYDIEPYKVEDAIRRLDTAVDNNPAKLLSTFAEFSSRDDFLTYCLTLAPPDKHERLNGSFYGDKQQTKLTEYTTRWGWTTPHGDVTHYRRDGTTLCGLDTAEQYQHSPKRPRHCKTCQEHVEPVE